MFISLFVTRYKNIFEKNELRTVKDLNIRFKLNSG